MAAECPKFSMLRAYRSSVLAMMLGLMQLAAAGVLGVDAAFFPMWLTALLAVDGLIFLGLSMHLAYARRRGLQAIPQDVTVKSGRNEIVYSFVTKAAFAGIVLILCGVLVLSLDPGTLTFAALCLVFVGTIYTAIGLILRPRLRRRTTMHQTGKGHDE